MKTRSPLRNKSPIERRTPLRATKFPKPNGEPGPRPRKTTAIPAKTRLRESAPARRRGTAAVVEAVDSASPSSLAFPKPTRRPKSAPAPIKRSRMKRKDPRRLDGPGSDPGYLEFIRSQPCDGIELFPSHICFGPVDPDHLRDHTGIGRKESDSTCVPKCRGLHAAWTDRQPPFVGWSNERRLEFHLGRMAVMRARWAGLTNEQRERFAELAEARRAA